LIIWIDAQLSPDLALWMTERFGIQTSHIQDLGLRNAKDSTIYQAARQAKAVVMTKDSDFAELLEHRGPPPQVIWITCGNTSNTHIKNVLEKSLPMALKVLEENAPLVEIADK
jgi:predicted nuclease of predicted toxin-antitoxin system